MKQHSFGEILGRAFIALAVALAPMSAFSGQAAERVALPTADNNVIHVDFHTRTRSDLALDEKSFHYNLDLPYLAYESGATLEPDETGKRNSFQYQTLVFNTDTAEQQNAVVEWINKQMEQARSMDLYYSFSDYVSDSADGKIRHQILLESLANPKNRADTVAVPVSDEKKETKWTRRQFNKLQAMAAKKLGPNRTADLIAFNGGAKMLALKLSKKELAYRSTFSVSRFVVNGSVAWINIARSTQEMGASLMAGVYMGAASAALQFWQKQINKNFFVKAGPITRAWQRARVNRAERIIGRHLTQEQLVITNNRVAKASATSKWGLTEAVYYFGAQAVLAIGGFYLLGEGWPAAIGIENEFLVGLLNSATAITGSVLAQSFWDTGNAEHKALQEKLAQTTDDHDLADFTEHLRSFAISGASVSALSLTMSPAPTAGFVMMGGMFITGVMYRNSVNRRAVAYECQQLLVANKRPYQSLHVPAGSDKPY